MEKKQLLVVGNEVLPDWDFRRSVENATGDPWDVQINVINRYDGLHRFTRYLTYLFAPLRLFFIRNRYRKIVYWEQFLGLVLLFYCRLFHVRKCPEITIMALIYKPKKGLKGRIFAWFVRFAVTSRYIRQIIVYSQSEVDYYSGLFGIPKEKLRAETLGIEDRPDLRGENAEPHEKYYISAGRSNRDYAFLRRAWTDCCERMVIVCDTEKEEDQGNLHYEKDCHGDAYLRLLAGAYASVVPLVSEKFSSGQLVFLQSFMLGIPVIATRNDTVADYVDDGVTGLIIPKTPEDLARALTRLNDPELHSRMSRACRDAYERRFSLYELGRRIGRSV